MGVKNYTLDLSVFDSIDVIKRSYIEESDYTDSLYIEGTGRGGDKVTVKLSTGGFKLYYFDPEEENQRELDEGDVLLEVTSDDKKDGEKVTKLLDQVEKNLTSEDVEIDYYRSTDYIK